MENSEKKYVIIEGTQDINSISNKLDRILKILEQTEGVRANNDNKLLTNNDVMRQLGISVSTLQKLRNAGKITFSQVGHKIFYKQSDIDQFITKNSIQTIKP